MYTINLTKQSDNVKVTEARLHVDRLVNYIKKLSDEEKVKKGEIPFRSATVEFINDLNAAIIKYESACVNTEEKTLTQEEVDVSLEELEKLNNEIAALEADPEINDITSVSDYQLKKERMESLMTIKTEIEKNEIVIKDIPEAK